MSVIAVTENVVTCDTDFCWSGEAIADLNRLGDSLCRSVLDYSAIVQAVKLVALARVHTRRGAFVIREDVSHAINVVVKGQPLYERIGA